MSDIVELCRGKWPNILTHFHISFKIKLHCACPVCGGKDRFLFDDKEGRGSFYCNHCGAGTGFKLLSLVKGWSMRDTLEQVEKIVGGIEKSMEQPTKTLSDADRRKMLNDTWVGATPSVDGDPVQLYISKRTGLTTIPLSLRYHPSLHHPETRLNHPAMIAKITNQDNQAVSIHRTYLTADGDKAKLDRTKMLMAGTISDGSAIRLFPYTDTLGIAEGIETAISCFALFNIPTWAAVSAAMLVKWVPPSVIRKVYIFADNDKGFTGQLAAYRLGWTLQSKGQFDLVRVIVPDITGADWNDILTMFGSANAKDMVKGKLD